MSPDESRNISNQLSGDSLAGLFAGHIVAIRIPNFYDKSQCRTLSSALRSHVAGSGPVGTIYLSDVNSFFNVAANKERENEYLEAALPAMQILRRISFPNASPSDLLRTRLDEEWTEGAKLMRLRKRAMLFGITRIWPEGSEGLPHQDLLLREIPDEPEIKGMDGQLGANIYIECAEQGGELEIWNHTFTSADVQRLGVRGSYGFDRRDIPTTPIRLIPQIGELIIINTLKVHAISKIMKGTRVTISGFIGHFRGRPLALWS